MYGIFTYIWLKSMVNVGKYTIHGSYGVEKRTLRKFKHRTLPIGSEESFTPPKTNMEPENEPLEEEIPIKNHHF